MIKLTPVIPVKWISDTHNPYEDTGPAHWTEENHDTDGDGVPNYLDDEPLNPNVRAITSRYREL